MLCIVSHFFSCSSFFFFIITFRKTNIPHLPEFRWSNGPLMPCFVQLFTAAVARAVSEPLQMDGSDKIYLQHCIHSIKTFCTRALFTRLCCALIFVRAAILFTVSITLPRSCTKPSFVCRRQVRSFRHIAKLLSL